MSSTDLTKLAWDLASSGFAGHDAAVRDVVRSARAHGISPVLVDIVADPRQPAIVRLRAYGLVAAALNAGTAPASAVRTAA